jgi:[ribosomal protein S5]-alanine N-acetyltransferase
MNNPFLIANRIYLRPVEREDASTILPWINDPEIRPFIRRYRPMNLAAETEFIYRLNNDEATVVLVIALKDGDLPIGVTGLHGIEPRNRSAEFGITIGEKAYWSQGYGTEATQAIIDYGFGTLNLNRIVLHVYEYNQRGIKCYDKIGFRKEGILRQEHYHDGRFWDTLVMSMLHAEWDQQKSGGN